jgi:hypothetical protein
MMDFLRGLAPQHVNSSSSASPALPSRFETDRPLRGGRAEDQSRGLKPSRYELSPDADLSASVEPLGNDDRSRGVEPSPDDPPGDRDRRVLSRGPKPSRYADNDSRDGSDEDRTVPRARVLVLGDTSLARHGESDAGVSRRLTSDATLADATPPLAAVQGPDIRRLGPAPLLPRDVAAVRAAIPESTSAAHRAEPLSSDAVAARATPRAEPRPVVHVTIDRIEVRMPPAADRPKPPASARRSSASESLGDYLRARQPDRRGGVS